MFHFSLTYKYKNGCTEMEHPSILNALKLEIWWFICYVPGSNQTMYQLTILQLKKPYRRNLKVKQFTDNLNGRNINPEVLGD